jgi:hypothetical protein
MTQTHILKQAAAGGRTLIFCKVAAAFTVNLSFFNSTVAIRVFTPLWLINSNYRSTRVSKFRLVFTLPFLLLASWCVRLEV